MKFLSFSPSYLIEISQLRAPKNLLDFLRAKFYDFLPRSNFIDDVEEVGSDLLMCTESNAIETLFFYRWTLQEIFSYVIEFLRSLCVHT